MQLSVKYKPKIFLSTPRYATVHNVESTPLYSNFR
jgi:hypothetical protein